MTDFFRISNPDFLPNGRLWPLLLTVVAKVLLDWDDLRGVGYTPIEEFISIGRRFEITEEMLVKWAVEVRDDFTKRNMLSASTVYTTHTT